MIERENRVESGRNGSTRGWYRGATCGLASAVVAVALASGALAQNKPNTPPSVNPPGAAPAPVELPPVATQDPELITLSAFAEPVQLASLVELAAKTLNVNITIQGDLTGTVVFNAPVPVKKSELIPLIDSLLEQQGWTITQNKYGFYIVQPQNAVPVNMAGARPTTRVFSTPNLRPSSLKPAIDAQFLPTSAPQGQQGGVQGAKQISYIDDLGIIIATDTPRRLEGLGSLIEAMLAEYAKSQFIRIELHSVAAPVARERGLQLVGQLAQPRAGVQGQDPNQAQNQQAQARAGAIDNLGDRLTIDPQGNALIFRGLPEEIDVVRDVISVIDVPNTLTPHSYFAGVAAAQIADIARSRGLGDVTTISSNPSNMNNQFGFDINQFQRQQQRQGQGTSAVGGPVMVVDDTRGVIIYYGTEEQHEQLAALVKALDTQSEKIVIQAYKLAHGDSEKVAEIINGILTNTQVATNSPLIGGAGSPSMRDAARRGVRPPRENPLQANSTNPANPGAGGANQEGLSIEGWQSFVIADKSNNQVIVKAPQGQQRDFAKLIERLDLRRPQVFIEARLIAVNWSDNMRLAFETQLINANGTGGVVNTNFGLGSFATGAAITGVKTVVPTAGLTAALIKSEYVPIIMNAMETEVNGKIISSPQLLVDDNEEAQIVSVDQQPTTSTTVTTGNPSVTGFNNYVEAGTTLKVTPQISNGGYLRLKYEAELSNFRGTGSNGIPPPRTQNNIKSDVTVPSDFTVVVGGFTLDNVGKTVIKVPLIGDIPLVGLLFQDRNTQDQKTSLYIFLTPRILRDENFSDLKLLTRGPQAESKLRQDVPPLSMMVIDSGSALPMMPPGPEPIEGTAPVVPAPAEEHAAPKPEEAAKKNE